MQPEEEEGEKKEISIYSGVKKIFSYRCIVKEGTSPILDESMNVNSPKVKPPVSVSFCGDCYMCGGLGHSKHYCPTKQCDFCKDYGHSHKVCPLSIKDSSLNVSKSFPPERGTGMYFRKYEFGSGWKKEKDIEKKE